VTFYKGVEQLPAFEDYAMQNRTYRYFDGQPLYPFGYGLSYSKFEYSNLQLSTTEMNAGDSLNVGVDVKNTSLREGDEVAQLYLSFPQVAGAPLRALRGFTRIHLGPDETRHVNLSLSPRDLSLVNTAGDRLVVDGTYRVNVGGGQPGTTAPGVMAQLSVRGEQKLPE
jgi:beta-glucosidase